jgi:3-hydroxyacyl-CoA dehydrogenase
MLDDLETFLTTTLGKGVVRALDTPNFVANRVGVFSMLAVMHHTERLGLGFDVVDALTGPSIGRPKSATYRTADVVGLDTLAHVIGTMQATLPADPWHKFYAAPAWLTFLIGKGALGQKTRAGIYRKEGKAIHVIDLAKQDYRPSAGEVDAEVAAILKIRNPAEKFEKLRAHASPQAQFLWAIFRDIFHYCAFHLESIADNARDVDFAMRWGFGWREGPFETWQAAGWQAIANAVKADIEAGKAMSAAPLPAWVLTKKRAEPVCMARKARIRPARRPSSRARCCRCMRARSSPSACWARPRSAARRCSRARACGCGRRRAMRRSPCCPSRARPTPSAPTCWKASSRRWRAPSATTGPGDLAGEAAVLGGGESRGAGAGPAGEGFRRAGEGRGPLPADEPDAEVRPGAGGGGGERHGAGRRLRGRHARQPRRGGAGVLHRPGRGRRRPHPGRRRLQGVRPARADAAARIAGGDIFLFLQPVFQTVAMANVSKSALEARELGFLRESDPVVFNAHEILHVARQTARALAESGWRPKLPPRGVKVAGRNGIATLEMMLVNMKEGGMISAHDYRVAKGAATALCGGEVETGTLVNEDWLLAVERHEFVELLKTEKTQQRIAHMLETGKPLRN